MNQPVPKITPADVTRILHRDFPHQTETARALLDQYGTERWHNEPDRVRIACLKLANGNLQKLRHEIDTAKRDYRDILAAAEYPNAFQKIPQFGQNPARETPIIQSDWQQYQTWFQR